MKIGLPILITLVCIGSNVFAETKTVSETVKQYQCSIYAGLIGWEDKRIHHSQEAYKIGLVALKSLSDATSMKEALSAIGGSINPAKMSFVMASENSVDFRLGMIFADTISEIVHGRDLVRKSATKRKSVAKGLYQENGC